MNRNVTVVPVDNLIIVDSEPLVFSFQADEDIHAIQWYSGHGEIEYKEYTNRVIQGESDYKEHVEYFVDMWAQEKEMRDSLEQTLEAEAQANYQVSIDAMQQATSEVTGG